MKTVLTVIGARPQFIKASVVSHAFAEHNRQGGDPVREIIVHTGQHYDSNMSEVFFKEMGIPEPDYHLEIGGGLHGEMTGRMLEAIERVLVKEKPDAVLVYGDTNSTLAGALAAVKLHIPVAHVEAGLRSFNMAMPEEINRIMTDRISRWLFTPTAVAAEHLKREGFAPGQIIPVGDVMFDVALHHGAKVSAGCGLLSRLGLQPQGYLLATIHRAENTDHPERLQAIVEALQATSARLPVVWPLHPRTRGVLEKTGLLELLAGQIHLIDPVGYQDMVQLEKFAAAIATDSGGVQKEAFFYQVPCITLRDETEWVELLAAGWNRLAPPTDAASLELAITSALGSSGQPVTPYGEGDAARRIVRRLVEDLCR